MYSKDDACTSATSPKNAYLAMYYFLQSVRLLRSRVLPVRLPRVRECATSSELVCATPGLVSLYVCHLRPRCQACARTLRHPSPYPQDSCSSYIFVSATILRIIALRHHAFLNRLCLTPRLPTRPVHVFIRQRLLDTTALDRLCPAPRSLTRSALAFVSSPRHFRASPPCPLFTIRLVFLILLPVARHSCIKGSRIVLSLIISSLCSRNPVPLSTSLFSFFLFSIRATALVRPRTRFPYLDFDLTSTLPQLSRLLSTLSFDSSSRDTISRQSVLA